MPEKYIETIIWKYYKFEIKWVIFFIYYKAWFVTSKK